jgi:hypothetical protein
MENIKELRKSVRRDRITLDPVNITRLQEWHQQLAAEVKGLKLKKAELVNFILETHAATLSPNEISELKKQFFDEVAFTSWALEELKRARTNGESLSLGDILNSSFRKQSVPRVKKKKHLTPESGNVKGGVSESN